MKIRHQDMLLLLNTRTAQEEKRLNEELKDGMNSLGLSSAFTAFTAVGTVFSNNYPSIQAVCAVIALSGALTSGLAAIRLYQTASKLNQLSKKPTYPTCFTEVLQSAFRFFQIRNVPEIEQKAKPVCPKPCPPSPPPICYDNPSISYSKDFLGAKFIGQNTTN